MTIKDKILTYLKLGAAMLVAFFISGLLNQEVFIHDSPKVRPHLGTYLIARVQGLTSSGPLFAFLNPGKAKQDKELSTFYEQQVATRLGTIPLTAVSKGVYAKEDDKVKYVEIHTDEMAWREYTITIKGEEVTIRMPANRPRMTPDQLEQLIQQ